MVPVAVPPLLVLGAVPRKLVAAPSALLAPLPDELALEDPGCWSVTGVIALPIIWTGWNVTI
jgi:hypothetical protein